MDCDGVPSFLRPDDKPVIQFDPRLEVSPFALFRRLRENRPPRLIDLRPRPTAWTLRGAGPGGENWRPASPEEEVVLFDDDGTGAVERADRLQREGYARVKALFGGLELYHFSLDPRVVGEETYLDPVADD